MNKLQLGSDSLPHDCVKDMQTYLRTAQIVANEVQGGYEATVLGVPCRVNCEGLGKDSTLVIIAARPVDGALWNFGKCFPELPGASEEAEAERPFRMRFLTLRKSLWLFVWGQNVTNEQVQSCLTNATWFQQWAIDRGQADANSWFGKLGFDRRELQIVPHATWKDREAGSTSTTTAPAGKTSSSGLFLWGDLEEASNSAQTGGGALALMGNVASFLGTEALRLTKAKVECEGGWAHLNLRLPAGGVNPQLPTDGGNSRTEPFAFKNVAVNLSSVPYFGPQDTSISASGDLTLAGDRNIRIDLLYPIEGDLILAKGTYTRGVSGLLGDGPAFSFPGLQPTFGANETIELELEFSQSAMELVRLSFGIEVHQQDWALIEEPILIKLDGVSFHFTVLSPLTPSRSVDAGIVFQTTLGLGDGPRDTVELACGGSYPSGDLFFHARNRVPVGRVINKFLGPGASTDLDRFDFDDLRLDYNYLSGDFALQFNVLEKWEIFSGFEAGGLRFQIKSTRENKAFQGSLAATIRIAEMDVYLAAHYRAQLWEFKGQAGRILIGDLFKSESIPEALQSLVFDSLELTFKSGARESFALSGAASLTVAGQRLSLTLAVRAEKPKADQNYQKAFEGEIRFGGAAFRFVFEPGALGQDISAEWHAQDQGMKLSRVVADVASQIGLNEIPVIPEPLDATLTSISLYLHTGTSDLVLCAQSDSGGTIVFAIFQSGQNKRYAILIDKVLHIGLSSLPLVGERIVEATSRLAGIEDVGIESLQSVITSGIGGNQAEYKLDIDKLNGMIDAAAARFEAGNIPGMPEIPETRRGKDKSRNTQVYLNATYFFSEKPQPPIAFPFDDAPRDSTSSSGSSMETSQGPAGAQSQATWLDVQRNFGPVSVKRLGIACVNGRVRFLLDASLVVSGLSIDLMGLSLEFPLATITRFKRTEVLDYLARNAQQGSTNLTGLSVTYENGPMAISGGLLKVEPLPTGTTYAFSGELLLKADTWALSVIGSFAQMTNGDSSMFAYGVLHATLGGPAFFFVTGIAAGFGYNRSLRLPSLNDLPSFPLIAASSTTGSRAVLASSIGSYIYPASGQNWLAAGVRFTSFKVIDSFALLTVYFGDRFEIGLLGLSTITVPARSKGAAIEPIAYAQIALEATYAPDDGVLKIAAQLMPGSYILSDKCRLTGGFALYNWFQDEFEKDSSGNPLYEGNTHVKKLVHGGYRSGDFLLSIGGYHPDFKPPAHYPSVPRVGANWRVNENLTIKGSLYFALTPLAIMAGGMLETNYQCGNLKAWFNSRADFLLYWEPLYYHANLNVSMGASYTISWWSTTKTISAQVTVDVELYGPPFGGKAAVDLYVCSFTIDFGDAPQIPDKLTWKEFEERFLPDAPDICLSRAASGLIKELPPTTSGEEASWLVSGGSFAIVTSSAIPSSTPPMVNTKSPTVKGGDSINPFGVKPSEIPNGHITSKHTVTCKHQDGAYADCIWEVEPITQRLPRAAWDASGPPSSSTQDREQQRQQLLADLAREQVTDELTTGFKLTPKPTTVVLARPEDTIDISQLPMESRWFPIPAALWESPVISRVSKYDNSTEAGRYQQLTRINATETIFARDKICSALRRQQVDLTARPGAYYLSGYALHDIPDVHYLVRVAQSREMLSAPFICELGEMHPS